MATETFYEQRMRELQQEKATKVARSNPLLQRPSRTADTLAGPSPMPQQPQEDEQPSYMKSDFFLNSERFRQEDPNFGPMMQNFTKLAMGLKRMVDQKMMPEPIARQRLEQFIQDHRQGYKKQELGSPEEGALMDQSTEAQQIPPADNTQMMEQSVEEVQNGLVG